MEFLSAHATNLMEEVFSFVVFVPSESGDKVRAALARSGAGALGNYDSCSFTGSPGIGRFRPLAGSSPAIGTLNTLETVVEERIETEVRASRLASVFAAVRAAHPYETPAIHVYGPLITSAGQVPIAPSLLSLSYAAGGALLGALVVFLLLSRKGKDK